MGVSEQDAAIQDSQGQIQDRTREHLGPTDVGHRRVPQDDHGCCPRAGSGHRAEAGPRREALRRARRRLDRAPDKDLATVMTERFGHRHGYVGGEYGFAD
jgi:hypothetical protein